MAERSSPLLVRRWFWFSRVRVRFPESSTLVCIMRLWRFESVRLNCFSLSPVVEKSLCRRLFSQGGGGREELGVTTFWYFLEARVGFCVFWRCVFQGEGLQWPQLCTTCRVKIDFRLVTTNVGMKPKGGVWEKWWKMFKITCLSRVLRLTGHILLT
jgi:hypothetical protein